MSLIRRIGSLLVLALVLACASDTILLPRQGLKYSVAQSACGPADGPALMLFFTRDPTNGPNPVAPYVRIYISDATNLDGHARLVTGRNAEADAMYVTTDTPTKMRSEVAAAGYITVGRSSTDNHIVGSVDIAFATAGHFVGSYNAVLFPNTALCP